MTTLYGGIENQPMLPNPAFTPGDGQKHLGVWINFRDPAVVDVVAARGVDWVCIDCQHGGAYPEEAPLLIEAAHVHGVPAVVRVPGHDVATLCRLLDAGPAAVIFPTVEDAESAAALVDACRFPPHGKRSYGAFRRGLRYPEPVAGDRSDDVACILMVETAKGLDNLDGILATGPDGIFVGPLDLALSLGQNVEDLFNEGPGGILADIARRCLEAGVAPGIYAGKAEVTEKMLALGFRFMPAAADSDVLGTAVHDAVSAPKLAGASK